MLARRQLLGRRRDEHDARVVWVRVTSPGRAARGRTVLRPLTLAAPGLRRGADLAIADIVLTCAADCTLGELAYRLDAPADRREDVRA